MHCDIKQRSYNGLFVKTEYVETFGDESYKSPLGNIVKALSYIEEHAPMHLIKRIIHVRINL